jgi:hypothetical protein
MYDGMDDIVREFRDIDADLRLVLTLTEVSWDLLYVRDDVEDGYSEADFETTYREHMGTQISSDNLGRTIDGGDYHGQMYFFEDIVVFQIPSSRYQAVVVSYDWDGTVPIERIIETADELDL